MFATIEVLMPWAGLLEGVALVLALDTAKREAETARQIWSVVLAGAGLVGLAWPAARWLGHSPPIVPAAGYLVGAVAGSVAAIWLLPELPLHLTSRSVAILARAYLPADQAKRISVYGAYQASTHTATKATESAAIAVALKAEMDHYFARKDDLLTPYRAQIDAIAALAAAE